MKRWNGPHFKRALDEHLERLKKHPGTKKSSRELQALRTLETADPRFRKVIQQRVKSLENGGPGGLASVLTSLTALQGQLRALPEYGPSKRSKVTKPKKPAKKGGK